MTSSHRYITTAIPYVNAAPHLGFAFELVVTDALARYARRTGADVRTLTGTDDNSLKNVRAAEALCLRTADFVVEIGARFRCLPPALGAHFDDFIATGSDPRHRPAVEELWRRCFERGDIYRRAYSGRYCVDCEQFYTSTETPTDVCPEHRTPLETVEEENYFFRLSRYQSQLLELIERETIRIEPPSRRAEILRFVRGGLHDFSVSRVRERARGWGIRVPGDPEQIVYVWFDALSNYLSALGFPDDREGLVERYWKTGDSLHVVGHGVLRFHAVYWVALLLSAGLPPPSTIFAHGYVTVEGEKISKSRGPVLDPIALAERHGKDPLRYALLRTVHTALGGDFSERRLIEVHDGELANQFGNLLHRTETLLRRHRGSIVPTPLTPGLLEAELKAAAREAIDAWHEGFQSFALHRAIQSAVTFAAAANRYAERCAPWTLAKRLAGSPTEVSGPEGHDSTRGRLDTVLYHLAEALRLCAVLFEPVVPEASEELWARLGFAPDDPSKGALQFGALRAGQTVRSGRPLFPRLAPREAEGRPAEG